MSLANQVWITSALSDKDVSNTLCLLISLRKTYTSRKLIVVVSEKVSTFNLKVLLHASDHLLFANEIWNTAGLKLDDFVKLFVLTLKSFQTCVYLSPTNLAIKNCDDIFDQPCLPPGFIGVSDDELSSLLVRPSPEVFDDLMKALSYNDRSVASFVSDWIKNRFRSPSNLAEGKYFARLMTKADLNSCKEINASIYNIVDVPIGTDLEDLDFLSNLIVTTRNQIYNHDVQPLLASLTPNHVNK
ncbi:unnamed protein product [Orchesella dallaii]|uniref:Uncharacterized protein n=1 Tax=Orchesella dallaii TaxID=48710 RepID=A0ABP1RK09_9HEXA